MLMYNHHLHKHIFVSVVTAGYFVDFFTIQGQNIPGLAEDIVPTTLDLRLELGADDCTQLQQTQFTI